MPEPTTGFIAGFLANSDGWGKLSFVVAGGVGSIISMQFISGMSFTQRIAALITGVLLADQFALPLAKMLGASEHAFGAAGMIGLFGFSTCGAIIKGIKEANLAGMAQEFVSAIATRITGGK